MVLTATWVLILILLYFFKQTKKLSLTRHSIAILYYGHHKEMTNFKPACLNFTLLYHSNHYTYLFAQIKHYNSVIIMLYSLTNSKVSLAVSTSNTSL